MRAPSHARGATLVNGNGNGNGDEWGRHRALFSHLVFTGDEEAAHGGLAQTARAHVQRNLLSHVEGLISSRCRRVLSFRQ